MNLFLKWGGQSTHGAKRRFQLKHQRIWNFTSRFSKTRLKYPKQRLKYLLKIHKLMDLVISYSSQHSSSVASPSYSRDSAHGGHLPPISGNYAICDVKLPKNPVAKTFIPLFIDAYTRTISVQLSICKSNSPEASENCYLPDQ